MSSSADFDTGLFFSQSIFTDELKPISADFEGNDRYPALVASQS